MKLSLALFFIYCVSLGVSLQGWSAWVKGNDTLNGGSYPSPGSFGNGLPRSRAKFQAGIFQNKYLIVFGGSDSTGSLSDVWAFNTLTNQWALLSGSNAHDEAASYVSTYTPGGRDLFSAAVDDASFTLWIFGGRQSSAVKNDLWAFNFNTSLWTWRSGSSGTNQARQGGQTAPDPGVYSASYVPSGRVGSSLFVDSSRRVWLFGGAPSLTNTSQQTNEVWVFRPDINQWAWASGTGAQVRVGSTPDPNTHSTSLQPCFYNHAGAHAKSSDVFYFYGTSCAYGAKGNELWSFETSTLKWTYVMGNTANDQAVYPSVKGVFASTYHPGLHQGDSRLAYDAKNDYLWLFGGSAQTTSSSQGPVNEVWVFDTAVNQWTFLSGSNVINSAGHHPTTADNTFASLNAPSARVGMGVAMNSDGVMYSFGGKDASNELAGLWRFTANCVGDLDTPRNDGQCNNLNNLASGSKGSFFKRLTAYNSTTINDVDGDVDTRASSFIGNTKTTNKGRQNMFTMAFLQVALADIAEFSVSGTSHSYGTAPYSQYRAAVDPKSGYTYTDPLTGQQTVIPPSYDNQQSGWLDLSFLYGTGTTNCRDSTDPVVLDTSCVLALSEISSRSVEFKTIVRLLMKFHNWAGVVFERAICNNDVANCVLNNADTGAALSVGEIQDILFAMARLETKSFYQGHLLREILPTFFYKVDGSNNPINLRDVGYAEQADVYSILSGITFPGLAAGEQLLETNVIPFQHLLNNADFTVATDLYAGEARLVQQLSDNGYWGNPYAFWDDDMGNTLINMIFTPAHGWGSQFASGDATKLYDLMERSRDFGLGKYNEYRTLAGLSSVGGNPELIEGLLADTTTTTISAPWKTDYPLVFIALVVKPIVDAIKKDRFGILNGATPAISTVYERYMCVGCIDSFAEAQINTPYLMLLQPWNGIHVLGDFSAYATSTTQLQDALQMVIGDDPLDPRFFNDESYYTPLYACFPPYVGTVSDSTVAWNRPAYTYDPYWFQCDGLNNYLA